VSLSIPVEKDSPVYNFFTAVNNFLISKHLVDMKILHTFVSKREEQHYVKFKIYKTTKIFVERENEGFNTIYDLYDYLVEGTRHPFDFHFLQALAAQQLLRLQLPSGATAAQSGATIEEGRGESKSFEF
jgi:hypothetical protein